MSKIQFHYCSLCQSNIGDGGVYMSLLRRYLEDVDGPLGTEEDGVVNGN